ncbi:hypothetical protein LIER_04261 [Lithospermum erythrorhizon]|uniref:Uncharacterized protein n=1 Tax=Lithospermum erythrorhizon TaxID=34254 RepID=A0AAV3NW26_LITER
MANKDTQRNQVLICGGVVERTLDEIFIFPDSDDEDNVRGLEFRELVEGIPESDEAEVFAANVLTEPTMDTAKSPKVPLLKRKATEAAYAMSLQCSESARVNEELERERYSIGESIRKIKEERDSALVSSDFPGISSHFQEYVSGLGDDYVVDLFDDIPDDDDEDVGADEEDSNASEGGEDV